VRCAQYTKQMRRPRTTMHPSARNGRRGFYVPAKKVNCHKLQAFGSQPHAKNRLVVSLALYHELNNKSVVTQARRLNTSANACRLVTADVALREVTPVHMVHLNLEQAVSAASGS
jgi:hypothetical protein